MTEKSEARHMMSLEYLGQSFQVSAAQCDTQWLIEFFSPSFQARDGNQSSGYRVSVEVNEEAYAQRESEFKSSKTREYSCFTLDGRFEKFPGTALSDDTILIHANRFRVFMRVDHRSQEIQILAAKKSAKIRLALMRVIRELATVHALRQGAIPFHGAACCRDDRSVGFLGRKFAGKTTTLLNHLLHRNYQFVANDRFFLSKTEHGWIVRGMPTIVKIRKTGLDHFSGFQALITRRAYHRERSLREIQQSPGKTSETDDAYSFSHAQFLEVAGVSAVTESPLEKICFPVQDDQIPREQLLTLTKEHSRDRLLENILSPSEILQAPELFDPRGECRIGADLLEERIGELAHELPCFELRQSSRNIRPLDVPVISLRAA